MDRWIHEQRTEPGFERTVSLGCGVACHRIADDRNGVLHGAGRNGLLRFGMLFRCCNRVVDDCDLWV